MAPTDPSPELAALPPELIARVVEQAKLDAHRTADFLDAVGLGPPPGGVRRLPMEFLLNLGAATRLLAWEWDGLTLHEEAGLPPADVAIRQVFGEAAALVTDPSAPSNGLAFSRAVVTLTLERLAWTGPSHFQAEILLGTPDEDALVETLARFLWDHRHDSPAGERGAMP